jgi:hypothetical protein
LLDFTCDPIRPVSVTILLSISQDDTFLPDKILDILQGDFFIELELDCELLRRQLQYLNLGGQNIFVPWDVFSGFHLSQGVFLFFIQIDDQVNDIIYAFESFSLKLIS